MTPTVHPASVLAACEAEAETWARETNIKAFVAKLSKDRRSREKLDSFARLCFVEGAYRGALNVIEGKSLAQSIAEAHATDGTGPQVSQLPEIRHSDKIEVKCIVDGFAETSVTTWEKLKLALYQGGMDEDMVRVIAKAIATNGEARHGGGSSPIYEYRKAEGV